MQLWQEAAAHTVRVELGPKCVGKGHGTRSLTWAVALPDVKTYFSHEAGG